MGGIKRARNGGKMLQKDAPFQLLLVIPAGEGPLLPVPYFVMQGLPLLLAGEAASGAALTHSMIKAGRHV